MQHVHGPCAKASPGLHCGFFSSAGRAAALGPNLWASWNGFTRVPGLGCRGVYAFGWLAGIAGLDFQGEMIGFKAESLLDR